MNPRAPNPVASYWGVDPTAVPPEDDAAVSQYWGADAVAPTGAAPAGGGLPYQPNPGLPNYNPNRGAPITSDGGAVLGAGPAGEQGPFSRAVGAVGKAFSNQDPLFQNPLASQPKPIDIGDIDSPPNAVDGGEIDRQPVSYEAGPTQASFMGPTQADDAAFEQFKAKQAAKASLATPARGGPTNPDPYGIGAAQKAQLGAMDNRMAAMDRAANAEQYKAIQTAEHQKNLARMQEEDAAIGRSEQEYAAKHFDEQMGEIGRQLDDVKSRKVDPLKDFKEQPALGVLAVVGGMVGGFYQGISGGHQNEFLADLERHIDRGVAEQKRQIDDEKFTLTEGINMLHQQRQAHKDDRLAEMQLRNLTYEAVKNEITAEAERDGTEVARQHANEGIELVRGQQAALQEQIAIKKQAQNAAAAAAAHAHAKEVQKAIFEQYEKNLASGMGPDQALDWSRHLVGLVYAPGVPGNPRPAFDERGGMTKEQRGKLAMEHGEAQHSSDEFNAQIDSMKHHPAIGKLGLTTGALSHLGQRVAPESTAVDQDLKTINTMVLQAVGKVAKDADGKPNKVMIEKLEERFEIHPTDTREMALQKLEGARDAVNALARQQGATGAPMPGARRDVAAKLGAKPVGR